MTAKWSYNHSLVGENETLYNIIFEIPTVAELNCDSMSLRMFYGKLNRTNDGPGLRTAVVIFLGREPFMVT